MSGNVQIEIPREKIEEFCRKWKIIEFSLMWRNESLMMAEVQR